MKAYEIVIILVGVSIVAGLCSYVGYIFWSKAHNEVDKPPHIILIVADDVGWNDVSFHGANQVPTPNIDALAYNGVILNRHYVYPTCSPSRTSLMTGRYAIREGMQGESLDPGIPYGIPLNVTLMPKYMRQLGYETRLLGKWNLGYYTENHTPARRGFDSFFGYYNGVNGYFNKTNNQKLRNGSEIIGYDLYRDGPDGLHIVFNNTEYFTDLITDEAEKIIKNNGNSKPLFIEIAHLAAHASFSKENPLEVRNVTENDETFGYIKDEKRRRHAGMMKALDDSVGRVVKALSEAGMLSNSIIVFMSDNGAPTFGYLANSGSNYPLRGIKGTLFDGGVRSASCVFSPLIKKSQRLSEKYVHITDWLPTFYSAAGGNITDLGEIDGVDQWKLLAYDFDSPRESMLLNIDEKKGPEAAILDRHKLIIGATESTSGYYGDTGNSHLYPVYNLTQALNSTAGQAIAKISGFFSSTREEAEKLRDSAVVHCQRPSNYSRCMGICLFDIVSDPCEIQDLSKRLPKELASLRSFIDNYRKSLVPQKNLAVDPCSLPQYFNGSWMPWRKDDANSTTIISESICNPGMIHHNNTNNNNNNNIRDKTNTIINSSNSTNIMNSNVNSNSSHNIINNNNHINNSIKSVTTEPPKNGAKPKFGFPNVLGK